MNNLNKIANNILTYGRYYKETDIIKIIMREKEVNYNEAKIIFLEMKHTSIVHTSSEKFYYLI